MTPDLLPERFRSKIEVQPDGCWAWTGMRAGRGYTYGVVKINRRRLRAHRLVYELLVGQVPEGLVLDHLCRVKHCVNPLHLEPVTHQVNIVRGLGHGASNSAKTHCLRGHEFNEQNTCYSAGRRNCRICCRERYNARRAALKAAA